MAAVATAPGLPRLRYQLDSSPLSTIRDPRTPVTDGNGGSPGSGASTPHHPDLNNELATLSTKLVSAINHQTVLDDALTAARQELETTHQQVRSLESDNLEYQRQLKDGELVTRADVDKIVDSFADDRRRTLEAEREKRRMEQELETLTSSLFEQANEMVSEARKETESIEHKNQQLRMQLKDTEALLANHQEQLAELKSVLEHMNNQAKADRDNATNSTGPSTPAQPSHPDVRRAIEDMRISTSAGLDDVVPAPPTSFSYLLSPVLRTNLSNYDDFRSLMDIGKKSAPNSRVNSGSYNMSSVPGLVALSSVQPSAGSLPGFINNNSANSPNMSPTAVPLKETKFYKRALTEDIEPTLRLDTAPGLSWLVRRAVVNSIVDGTLVIEPTPSTNRGFVLPCSLCGENRNGEEFARTHRFKNSEAESAQRYPLCTYCLNRMRAACDYISFLRMVKDGHWRTEGVEAEKSAWEESVRLRERMFWARIGGGVVPATTAPEEPKPAGEDSKPNTPFSAPPLLHSSSFGVQDDSRQGSSVLKKAAAFEEVGRVGRPKLGSAQTSSASMITAKERSASVSPAPPGSATPLKESLAIRSRTSRQASYERERVQSPEVDTLADATGRGRSSASPSPARGAAPAKSGEQGLHISIPNYSY